MELEKIRLIQKNLRDICAFGHIDYQCPHIPEPGRGKYCVSGRCAECEHYQDQMKRLEGAYS